MCKNGWIETRLLQAIKFVDILPPDTVGPSRSPKHYTGITADKRNRVTKEFYYEYTNTATSDKLRLADVPTEIRAGARLQNLALSDSEGLRFAQHDWFS